MKKGVRIINCARGELVDDAALAAALKSGQVAGAALDVFTEEPPKNCPYVGLDNVILTPHIAGSTAEAQEAVGIQIAMQVREYLKLGVVQNAVNLPSLSHEEYVQLAPYIDLAGRLGSFLAQAGRGGIDGNSAGLWRGTGGCENRPGAQRGHRRAAAGLREREPHQCSRGGAGARHSRARGEAGEPARRCGNSADHRACTRRPVGSHATATVIHGEQPRLLEFDGIDIEAPLEGNLLICRNIDVPGVIGKIGTILGEHGVNIANFALGRERSGTKPVKALAVVQVDAPVSQTVLEALQTIEALLEVKLVQL